MPGININFTGVQKVGPVPKGDYRVTISEFQTKPAKNGESEVSAVVYIIDEPIEFNGKKIWDNISWHPKALPFARAFMEAVMGTEELGEVQFEDSQMIGESLGITVIEEEYEGRLQNKVVAYF